MPYTLPEGEAHLWLYRDVTERKQRKQELDRSRQFLRDTQEVAHIGGWKLDLQSESLRWSDEVYRIHGLPPDADVRVEDAIEFYHPDDRDTIRKAVDRLTSEGEPYDVELRIVTVDDDVRWVRALGEPVYEDDELIAVQGTFQDITERKEREQELQMVRERFERFASNVEDAFFLLPIDYSETEYVNPAVETIYGITPEEAYDDSMAWLRHVHPDDKDELLAEMEAQQDETSDWPREQEFRIDHPDRGVRWVQARIDAITDENGDPSQLTGVATDITEQIKHEQQLEHKTEELEQLARKYETQYRTLFEEAPVMTILTRSEDGQPIIDDCNSQFVETLGYDADTIIGSELAEFYTPESAERLRSQGYSQALNGQFTREKRELLTIDGETIEALLRAVPRRTADGSVIGTVAMYIDISERESVKRANEQLEEFASVVSHDLRNPLNVATSRLELAAEECDSAHLDDLEGALDRMGALIDDLLLLAREGKEVTDAQPVDLTTIVNGCWENVETNQASLITTIDRSVWADRSRLKQVFENLFRNAVEHGRADVTVTIGGLNDGFYIEDDGPGIPSDERDAVFEAGYSQSTDGTGFGLSIVEQIVTAHDWNIRVTDGADGGARFEITNVEFVATENSASSKYRRENN
ncbi:PAS domain-containing sensor histidine kinase [Halorubrum sp. 48-1-W]|uniref:PAS domain-containing sensor histidine kinase n=1 Tax=Halorubrum sp. 48-1-W TaxID=2249761 RepID=UPI0018E54A3D|nr:PAS domain S-box protein [Halorubrum sp. 48-1-W]